MTHIKMILSLFTPIERSSNSEEINQGYMSSIPNILQKIPMLYHSERRYGGIHKNKNREVQVRQKHIQQCRATKYEELQAHNLLQNGFKLSNISSIYKKF